MEKWYFHRAGTRPDSVDHGVHFMKSSSKCQSKAVISDRDYTKENDQAFGYLAAMIVACHFYAKSCTKHHK